MHLQILEVQRYQALTHHGQQKKVDTLIGADKRLDGSEGHLSDMQHTVFHSMTGASIRAAAKVQGDQLLREQIREQRKRHNTHTTIHNKAQNSPTATNNRHKPYNGAPKQTKPIGQAREKKRARKERAYPYCKVMPAPHRFSQCPPKASNQAKQAEERVQSDTEVARLSISPAR
ncbi:hypothetical protein SARC_03625 [Sphaeroforma arctica JP610]|uniref:Uncharacterized protein n=1 Tax=Sphaeroforma arctica JP610 TaxID=667725 RepID=A0A0L0G7F5_9EUKA|nr:hypothetical protein SARC_03625 [Sphaeroforma arctica JP610]KNC84143.1 hypothetical protein SARC_03625 [Sphaeroforma arctica JP610]|eukprot:XP_014158045.1 hypothetical protein SARC_03625 [Sphaeroforma arctica JP610]